jgi:hypothetical protein
VQKGVTRGKLLYETWPRHATQGFKALPIKARHEERSTHTHKSQKMGTKEPEPWSPRWVRQQHRESNNVLPPNDPNCDHKPLADVWQEVLVLSVAHRSVQFGLG